MISNIHWRKSSRSTGGGNCVEVGFASAVVAVRDTKDRERGMLTVSPAAWANFVDGLKNAAPTPRHDR
ncbi:DUF397 domain-containing protein [Actinopolyspora saharensis]|uniref:DUF397 domain-containing protein n=1 Tax=Actinopolyspora saharensis TaxID=995062 RepID=A0A1H1E2R2_9ACTN|nr:DUF397 domain-containing protein [Actinopolyspora saharensis]SDQ82890.1 protein of unknown function [Actinopolyspora saharensis]